MQAPRAKVRLCGRFEFEIDGEQIADRLPAGQARSVLTYLAANRANPPDRAKLVDLVWPQRPPKDPQSDLRPILSRLRRAIAPATIEGRERLRLELPEPAWIDVEEAVRSVEGARAAADGGDWDRVREASSRARELLSGGFLPAHEGEWVEVRRRELAELELEALELAARSGLARGGLELRDAERAARQMIDGSPYRETGYRLLMEVLAADGNPAEALRVYEQLRRVLRDELGATPAAELQALHQRLLAGEGSVPERSTVVERRAEAGAETEPSGGLSAATIRYAHNGDVSIAYTVLGDGPVDMLFIGGFISHLEIGLEPPLARRFWERLASFARVIVFDKRGMGLSDRDAGVYALENVVDDALAVLDACGVERAVVFGVSEGGSAATMLAATHPDRVTAMVQYGTYARVARADDYPEGIPVEVMRRFWDRMIETWGDPSSIENWAPSAAHDPAVREWWARWLRSGASPGTTRTIGLMYEDLDVRPLLSAVAVPTLVLYRAEDRLVPPALPRTVARGIPGAREVALAGADHLFLAGDQDAMLDEVEEFVTGHAPAEVGDRMLATVLVAEIVRSTSRAAGLWDRRWRELSARYGQLAERELARHRGRLVKHTADGVLATFDGPARAVRSALAIRDGARALGLDVRAGVHIGECELSARGISGIAVHLAERVLATAQPGEVITSGTVKDLVVGSGLEFDGRGAHVLDDLSGEWALFAITGDSEQSPVATGESG